MRPPSLRGLVDAPRNSDGTYNLRELVEWQVERFRHPEEDEDDREPSGEVSGESAIDKAEADAELTRWRAIRERFKHEQELGRWIRIEDVRRSQSALQHSLAQLSEKLGRECGDDAKHLFDKAVDRAFDAARRELRDSDPGDGEAT